MSHYTLRQDLLAIEVPQDGILSRTIHADERSRTVLFAFGQGQELTEHTAAVPAEIVFLQGQMRLTVGGDEHEVGPGAWIRMEAHLPHSVLARTPSIMLLTLLRGGSVPQAS
jgi:quercetin dioxygenase-like cupin family protein